MDIYEENSDEIIGSVTRKQLLSMIRNGTVSGVGSWKRLRKLRRVSKPVKIGPKAVKGRRLPVAEDSYTWEMIPVPGGGRYFQHHGAHCAAYSAESRSTWQ